MIGKFFSPVWFQGKDIFIDLIGIFVLVIIAYFSLRYYKIYKRSRNYLYLALSFLLLALSFLFKIIINVISHYNLATLTNDMLFRALLLEDFKSLAVIFHLAIYLYQFLAILGLYLLFTIYQKQLKINLQSLFNLILMSYFFLLITIFVHPLLPAFYFTSFLILFLITLIYWRMHYLKEKRIITTKLLLSSFITITLSQAIFIFIGLNNYIYMIGEITQLVGYILLLITFITILFEHGRKKK